MKAEISYYDGMNDITEVKLGDHHFGFGGMGDGYCYGHQSFDCLDNLSEEELKAVQEA